MIQIAIMLGEAYAGQDREKRFEGYGESIEK